MPKERRIPGSESTSIVSFEILINGAAMPQTYNVVGIRVFLELNRVCSCHLTFADGNPALGEFAISNNNFNLGDDVEIKLGYEGNTKTVFKGIVTKQRTQLKEKKSLLLVECKDKNVLLTKAEKNKVFEDTLDSDVVSEILNSNGLKAESEATAIVQEKLVQYACSDWDFLLSRAEANGLVIFTDQNIFKTFTPKPDQEPKVTLSFGATILELDTEINSEDLFEKEEKNAWSFTDQALLKFETNNQILEPGNVSSSQMAGALNQTKTTSYYNNISQQQELDVLTEAENTRAKLSKLMGTVKAQGIATVFPGNVIELQGVGKKFEGNAFVSGVSHELYSGAWTTTFQLGMNSKNHLEKYNPKPKSQTIQPVTNGLEIAKVIQLEGDPLSEDRIKINIPSFDQNQNGIWARVSNPDAGKDRGVFFRPEIDDEVVVGFINNDPRAPIVLGGLHSSTKAAPFALSDNNHEKGLVTRSAIKLIFNDEKSEVTIETAKGNKIVVSDDDESILIQDLHGNSLKLNDGGITLDSPKDFNIKATGDLNLEGLNVNIKATAALKGEGTSGLELSSSAITEIKGSLVQIN